MGKRSPGHIEQLPSGSWRVKVYGGTDPLTGREIRLRKTCKTERAAQIELVQEPAEPFDAERASQLAAIGIIKGQPFASDERMRAILDKAARVGAGMARALAFAPRDP